MIKQLLDDAPVDGIPAFESVDSPVDAVQPAVPDSPVDDTLIGDSSVFDRYANYCRVNGTPAVPHRNVGLDARSIDTVPSVEIRECGAEDDCTVKRLLQALGLSIERPASIDDVPETDVQSGSSPPTRRTASASTAAGENYSVRSERSMKVTFFLPQFFAGDRFAYVTQ